MFNKKKSNYFYESLLKLFEGAEKSIKLLEEGIKNFDSSKLLELKNNIHNIEHHCDLEKHEVEEKLAKEFITPIDRADIFLLLDCIDDLIDSIDEISYKLYLRNYKELPEGVEDFVIKSNEAILATKEVIANIHNLKNKKIMDPLIKNVQNLEEELDRMYEEKVRVIYTKLTDYREIRLTERIYEYFEFLGDKCRDICKEVSIIMFKNL